MANGPTRGVFRIVLQNFINSLKPRQIRGNHIGKDYIGNVYFEIPADPNRGKRKPSRWYDPPKGLDFQDPIPAEWQAWLRMTRKEPPTEEEIAKNLAVAKLKKINAAKIEEKRLAEGGSLPVPPERGPETYPTYPEYHTGHPDNHPKNKPNVN
ncbi:NADH dehydrogenase [ubiquinone] 1 alpha subcomplex assembly factor 2 [Plodia interpunctella]|uniref:NADH dehydrogenase [ubiquinone] 1 alpha subcomplex assembly factor 2 n=1 Tax=Plodia interpunctella TaxID=58824 RepID=UPI002368D8BA|nr:NADH dehydrogenase [ubiquinone] 1 alpha subcomplex assembly factor 2 [Plodia interpunctella]XP_053621282.1 NADH dehydrogenase [ubiquinone] 1 alpha subcomplex assembly factor 2 [Plodia interpunctella]